MNVVLISTYELGRQPFGLASPAAWLRAAGHQVVCLDLARQELDERAVQGAGLVAVYLPMHTATRLAARLLPRLRALQPQAWLCCYGLYAPMNSGYLRKLGVRTILGGEFENGLLRLAAAIAGGEAGPAGEPEISLERLAFRTPDRAGLPALENYAHLLLPDGRMRITGSTEASRGCKHLCRHCPVVPVYQGVFRIVARDVVLADIRAQVAAGAEHISFGDPDFFNGIRHAMELVEDVHREFPEISYDVTIKIEHLLQYRSHLPRLRETGCLFVTSAVESVDDRILEALDKGHTRADFLEVAGIFRELDLALLPTFVPFTPWTTIEGYVDLLEVLEAQGMAENVAPVQLGIRLLIPEGSRLLELDAVRGMVGEFDAESLVYPWKNIDPRVDQLAGRVQRMAAESQARRESRSQTFDRIWAAAHLDAGVAVAARTAPDAARRVPFLSEPWYCCAEPTDDQLVSILAPAEPVRRPAEIPADGFV